MQRIKGTNKGDGSIFSYVTRILGKTEGERQMKKTILILGILFVSTICFAEDVVVKPVERSGIQIKKKLMRGEDFAFGLALIMAAQPQAAMPRLQKAIQEKPDDAYAYALIGIAHDSLGQKEEAAKNYERAKKLFEGQGDYENAELIEKGDFNNFLGGLEVIK